MSEVQRYDLTGEDAYVSESKIGDFVEYDDYVKLKDNADRLAKDLGEAVALFDELMTAEMLLPSDWDRVRAFLTRIAQEKKP